MLGKENFKNLDRAAWFLTAAFFALFVFSDGPTPFYWWSATVYGFCRGVLIGTLASQIGVLVMSMVVDFLEIETGD